VPELEPEVFFLVWGGEREVSCGAHDKGPEKVFLKEKIADGHPHRFRDTAAIELLKAGVDISKVCKFLVHAPAKYYAPWNNVQPDIMDDAISATQDSMEMHI
jgi:hypothetical protein